MIRRRRGDAPLRGELAVDEGEELRIDMSGVTASCALSSLANATRMSSRERPTSSLPKSGRSALMMPVSQSIKVP